MLEFLFEVLKWFVGSILFMVIVGVAFLAWVVIRETAWTIKHNNRKQIEDKQEEETK